MAGGIPGGAGAGGAARPGGPGIATRPGLVMAGGGHEVAVARVDVEAIEADVVGELVWDGLAHAGAHDGTHLVEEGEAARAL